LACIGIRMADICFSYKVHKCILMFIRRSI
jgi:hypothetical protein